MNVFIDNDYKCHVEDDGTMRAFEVPFFDGKCKAFIEGYRYVPSGETWTRSDGVQFMGAMIAPWKDYNILAAYQEQYEEMLAELEATKTELADADAALSELGVEWEEVNE